MFDSLSERLSGTLRSLTGKSTITESNIQEALRDVRRALLEADVALSVVKDFVERVRLSSFPTGPPNKLYHSACLQATIYFGLGNQGLSVQARN